MQADTLDRHLDSCPDCRQRTDEFFQQSDSLVLALRRKSAGSAADTDQLRDWIEAAQYDTEGQAAAPTVDESPAPKPRDRVVSLTRFLNYLEKSRLFDAAQVAAIRQSIDKASLTGAAIDTQTVADQMVDDNLLSPFQARALIRGRWKGLMLGDYVVLEKIGQGGMGQVYRGRRRGSDEDVCLKVLHSSTRESQKHLDRFRNEARAISSLQHPNIVAAHHADESDGIPYLAMELIRGSDLARYVKHHGPMSPAAAIRVIVQTARALVHAHERGIIHRDIKPHNLMLDAEGTVKILDMGLARFQLGADGSAMTQTGAVLGTIDYMSPEQAMNARSADARADVYSLGCTLHYLLTGRPPYKGETAVERLIAHREQPAPSLAAERSDIPERLDIAIRRALAKRPENRHPTARAFIEELEAAYRDLQQGANDGLALAAPLQPLIPVADETAAETTGLAPTVSLAPVGRESAPLPELDSLAGVEPLADIGLNNPPTAAAARTLRGPAPAPRRRVGLWIAGGAAAAIGAASIVGMIISVASAGRSGPMATGGRGAALVVVSPYGFSDKSYAAITDSLKQNGVQFLTASVGGGQAKSSSGARLHIDRQLDQVNPQDFDAVFYCAGKTERLGEQTELIMNTLRAGRAVVGVEGGFKALRPIWQAKGGRWDKKHTGWEELQAAGGRIVKVCTDADADRMIDEFFDSKGQ
jgi:hypothetical protein